MNLTTVKIADLQPHPQNFNRHPESQIIGLMKSLDDFDQFKNIVVSNGVILAGHALVEAAKRKGWTEIDAEIRDNLTDDQQKALLAADVALPSLAYIDPAALESLLSGVVMEIPGVTEEWTEKMGVSLTHGDFESVSVDNQPRLDQKNPITCPKCGHEFVKES